MLIVHEYKNTKIVKESEGATGLILGNDLGSYFYLTDGDETRYQGFFYCDCKSLKNDLSVFKIIDSINISDCGQMTEIKNGFFEVSRKYSSGISEKYFLPNGYDVLCLKTNRKIKAEVILDIRHPYDSRSMGRFYEFDEKNGSLVIKFTKRRDLSEDGMADKKEYTLYLAIKTDTDKFKKIGQFFSKYYAKDHKRNSSPWDRFVFKAAEIECKEAVFAVGKTPKEASDSASKVFKNFEKLYELEVENIHKKLRLTKISDEEIRMAYLCAQNSIYTLLVETSKKRGAYAGLPWFFQFWTRDEAVSLLEINKLNEELSLDMIKDHIKSITNDGQMPKQRLSENISGDTLKSADSLGWLMDRIGKLDYAGKLPEYLKIDILEKIEKTIAGLIQKRTVDDLAINYNNETWMDSLERSGQRIEIQAGILKTYKVLYDLTGNDQYKILENELKEKVLAKFYENGILLDSPTDRTVRPNAFIAAYLYPELLSMEQWEACFDKLLEKLYLSWGGISTVDTKCSMFVSRDTGENSPSYHNGNSWYWVNNLTALVLYRTNPHKYSEYINSIMESNTKEILYEGIAGHHSEISDADKKSHSGCNAQLWSSAMYLEVFDEILKS